MVLMQSSIGPRRLRSVSTPMPSQLCRRKSSSLRLSPWRSSSSATSSAADSASCSMHPCSTVLARRAWMRCTRRSMSAVSRVPPPPADPARLSKASNRLFVSAGKSPRSIAALISAATVSRSSRTEPCKARKAIVSTMTEAIRPYAFASLGTQPSRAMLTLTSASKSGPWPARDRARAISSGLSSRSSDAQAAARASGDCDLARTEAWIASLQSGRANQPSMRRCG
jgi:hypothetical protein